VIFFNNVGYLGMCGHGTIGLMVTLHHLGQLGLGEHRLDTPVGEVRATIHDANTVSFENVPSYRFRTRVQIDVESYGKVVGDIAWGGNWFFLADQDYVPVVSAERERLIHLTRAIRRALERDGITGEDGGLIDHIEVFGPADDLDCDSRNFVLCPGGAYDRSPCGTGTSAKVACLAADGKLQPGELWRQASIIGSVFEASYRTTASPGQIIPTIRGTAYLCGESTLMFDDHDPFVAGIPS
jgi:4-hydroxyproline epimerase